MEQLANPARRRLFRGRIQQKQELRLPWIVSEQTFLSKCTQCNDCVAQCETQIIVKDDLGYPKVDFTVGECTDCKKCIEVCKEDLFKSQADIESVKPWPVEFKIEKSCLASNQVYCQSCKDVCDARAITFSYEHSSIPTPTLDVADCTQCGACVQTCPQDSITTHFNTEKHS